MKRNPNFKNSYNANDEVINADGHVVCACDASVRQEVPPVEPNPESVSLTPRCVQEEHPEMFDGTEAAAAWKPLSHGSEARRG